MSFFIACELGYIHVADRTARCVLYMRTGHILLNQAFVAQSVVRRFQDFVVVKRNVVRSAPAQPFNGFEVVTDGSFYTLVAYLCRVKHPCTVVSSRNRHVEVRHRSVIISKVEA